jgi:hypothetical protein
MKFIKWLCLPMVLGAMLTGCASLPKMDMLTQSYTKAPVYVDTLSFEKFKRPDKWESDAEWAKHVAAWQQQFWGAMINQFSTARHLDASAKQGMIAKPCVTNIERHYIQMIGGRDFMQFEVELFDAATNKKIGMINFQGNSDGAGYGMFSFGGRMGECSRMGGDLLGRVLDKNQQAK